MKEKRAMIKPVAEFLTYKIRSGEISSEGGDKIWRIALDTAEKVDEMCIRDSLHAGFSFATCYYDGTGLCRS